VLKRVGVTSLISLSACGSFKEELPPGTFVLVDQFVDRTHKRESSFFGKGCVAHVSMAHPVSPRLHVHLAAAAEAEGIAAVRGGTYVCMEGPQFSSLAESQTYKAQGHSVIGMTNMPEAKLAREAARTAEAEDGRRRFVAGALGPTNRTASICGGPRKARSPVSGRIRPMIRVSPFTATSVTSTPRSIRAVAIASASAPKVFSTSLLASITTTRAGRRRSASTSPRLS
jgi:hypothetical protein